MVKPIMSMKVGQRGMIGIAFCIVFFIIGYIILNHVSTMEDPPLGNTIYILIGSSLSILSVLGVFLILKYMYDYNKKKERHKQKRRKHKLSFLKNHDKKSNL